MSNITTVSGNAAYEKSSYQIAIEKHFTDMLNVQGLSTLVIEAKAGSGKTTVLENLCAILKQQNYVGSPAKRGFASQDAVVLSFNRDIALEGSARITPLTGVPFKTINSLGNGALWLHLGRRDLDVKGNKYNKIIFKILERYESVPKKLETETCNQIAKIIDFYMASLLGMQKDGSFVSQSNEQYAQFVLDNGLDMPVSLSDSTTFDIVREALAIGEQQAHNHFISFNEQIYLPLKWNLNIKKYAFIFVDEAQDLSPAKLELCLRARNGNTKSVFVGDSFQAIYAFAGADCYSMQKIITRTTASVLPLDVCYRCSKAVIRDAQEIVPAIQHAPNAIEGSVVKGLTHVEMMKMLQPGDIVLSRTNAPLMGIAMQLLGMRKAVVVKGKDIGDNIVSFAKNALGARGEWKNFSELVTKYYDMQMAKLEGLKDADGKRQALTDRYQCVITLHEAFDVTTFEQFEDEVTNLFKDRKGETLKNVIELSSIHKAKGLGRTRVFKYGQAQLKWNGQTEEEAQQERNLDYVSRTRAKVDTYYVIPLKPGEKAG